MRLTLCAFVTFQENITYLLRQVLKKLRAQEEPKSLPPDAFHGLQICLNSFCGELCPQPPLGEAYSAPPNPLAGLRGPTSKGKSNGRERRGGEGRRGREGRGREGRGKLHHSYKLFKPRCTSNIHSNVFYWACHKYMEQLAINCKFFYITITLTNNSQYRFFTVYEVQLILTYYLYVHVSCVLSVYFIFWFQGSYECHSLTFLSSFYLVLYQR